jgi:hypothetical protein
MAHILLRQWCNKQNGLADRSLPFNDCPGRVVQTCTPLMLAASIHKTENRSNHLDRALTPPTGIPGRNRNRLSFCTHPLEIDIPNETMGQANEHIQSGETGKKA